MVIPIAHDFTCSWCWIGFHQVQALEREFGVTFEWKAYELYPETMPLPGGASIPEVPTNRPKTPSRLALAFAAQGIDKPSPRETVRTHHAHEAVELAKQTGRERELVERIYLAFWEKGENIGDPQVIESLASGLVDPQELNRVLEERPFADRITSFDDPAYASGVYNVPTYWIGGERYAEQPLAALRKVLNEAIALG